MTGEDPTTDPSLDQLGSRAARAGAVTVSAQVVRFAIRIAGLALLARLLVPGDFGLLAKTLAIVGFVRLLRDAGLSTATVQRQNVSLQQITNLFWTNVSLSTFAALATAVASPLLVWLYRDPSVLLVNLALSGVVFLSGLPVQHRALLQRRMQFSRLATAQICAIGAGVLAAAIAAWHFELGYWSLVIQQYVVAIVEIVGFFSLARWLPGRPRRGAGTRPMLVYGGHLTGATLLGHVRNNADDILLGVFSTDTILGLYSVGFRLFRLSREFFVTPLNQVAIPTLSRLQDQPERFRAYYFRGIEIAAGIGMPIVCFIAATAPVTVELLLGPAWLGSVPILWLLSPAAFLSTFNVATGWVFTSLGRADRKLRWAAVGTTVNVIAIGCGLPWGAIGVAAGLSISQALLRGPALVYCFHGTFLRLRDLLRTLVYPSIASLGAALILLLVTRMGYLAPLPLAAIFGISLAGYGIAYVCLWLVLPGGAHRLVKSITLFYGLLTKRDP